MSKIEPKKVDEALKDESWATDMNEELDQFERNQIKNLVEKPNSSVIEIMLVYKNNIKEAKLVAQGYFRY